MLSVFYSFLRIFYTVIFTIGIPVVLLRLWWKGRKNPGYRQRISERFGFFSNRPTPGGLWVHTVSVGEFLATVPLIRALQKRFPDLAITVTTTTPTGSAQVQKVFGDLDLRNVHVLSDHQLLWSTGQLSSNISSFFASKLLRSRIRKLDPSHFPTLLQNPKFKGHVYRLSEIVLDPASLLKTLADPIQKCLLKTHTPEYQAIHDPNNPQNIVELQLPYPDQQLIIKAKRFVLTAGQGNQSLSSEPMQKRPLHMVVMKAKNLSPLYAHCIGSGSTPRMTITTHTTQDGSYVWYLGGDLAESGTQRTQEEQVAFAKKEVQTLFPWFDTQDIEWFSFFIDRAEPKQKDGKRPETAFIEQKGNVITAWPTKLALSPILSDSVVEQLQRDNIQPSTKSSEEILAKFPKPSVAKPMWEASSTE